MSITINYTMQIGLLSFVCTIPDRNKTTNYPFDGASCMPFNVVQRTREIGTLFLSEERNNKTTICLFEHIQTKTTTKTYYTNTI